MAVEIPVIPKATAFYLHTGNIVNWNRLKRRISQSPNEEVSSCTRQQVVTFQNENLAYRIWPVSIDRVYSFFLQIYPHVIR